MNKLNIFVSSTCYDLSQIRADLFDFIENLGNNPILSEYLNFPVNPAKNTITNCIDAVKDSADIFILVIGNRYGNTVNNGKSITNSEFLTARNKGIPIYVFILKSVLNVIPIWKTNKSADYSSVVDNTAIFEFICEIREDNKIRVHANTNPKRAHSVTVKTEAAASMLIQAETKSEAHLL